MATPRRGKWVPCPEGELADLGDRLRTRQRRRRFLQAAAGSVAAVVAGGLLVAWLRPSRPGPPASPGEVEYAGIACGRVKEQADGYARKTLAAALHAQIRAHLDLCPSCRDHYKALGLL